MREHYAGYNHRLMILQALQDKPLRLSEINYKVRKSDGYCYYTSGTQYQIHNLLKLGYIEIVPSKSTGKMYALTKSGEREARKHAIQQKWAHTPEGKEVRI